MDQVFNHVEEMLFTGGEPFLSRQHFYILEQLVQRGQASQVSLRYHSNLTHLPEQLLEYWSHFKSVQINCSIEAVGELNNYIRYPSKWQEVDANIRKVLSLKTQIPVYMEFHTVFQALSILRITELLDYLLQFKDEAAVFPYFISMDYPEALRVEALPVSTRRETRAKILNFINEREELYFTGEYGPVNKERFQLFESCWERLIPGKQKTFEKKFFEWNLKMDRFRRQSLQNVLPEIDKIYPEHP
jgi:sulfatase maturation enzyme AslB (radical SAM superfamily)